MSMRQAYKGRASPDELRTLPDSFARSPRPRRASPPARAPHAVQPALPPQPIRAGLQQTRETIASWWAS
eukprot:6191651-Pleurochrysis_carterae.AAC.1